MSLSPRTAMETARVLADALPYIQHFHHKTIVLKYGGAAMVDEALQSSFAKDVVLMKLVVSFTRSRLSPRHRQQVRWRRERRMI